MERLRLRLLGPLRVWDGTTWTPVHAAQQRVVLAVLAIEAGRVVATDRLIDEIWGDRPPRHAASVVRGYVMRLRQQLGGGRDGPLVTGAAGYMLTSGPDEVDASVFDGLVAIGRRELSAGDREAAVAHLAEALALWHGPPLADVPHAPGVAAEARRWEEERLTTIEDWLGAHLDLGRHQDVLSELYRFVDEHPLRERCWAYLMQALHRLGRRAEALESFERARRVMVAEPGIQLRGLQCAILSAESRAVFLVPQQLPLDPRGFTGREPPLKKLDEAQHEGCLLCVVGMAGVGETLVATGRTEQARDAWRRALAILQDLGR